MNSESATVKQDALLSAHEELLCFFFESDQQRIRLANLIGILETSPESEHDSIKSTCLECVQCLRDVMNELLNSQNEDFSWLCRRAHSRMFIGELVKDSYASYHDAVFFEATGLGTALLMYAKGSSWFQTKKEKNKFDANSIREIIQEASPFFEESGEIHGRLKMEMAVAIDIFYEKEVVPFADDLDERDQTIRDALGSAEMQAQEIAEKAGYPNNSSFRGRLSQLVKRRRLKKSTNGYRWRM